MYIDATLSQFNARQPCTARHKSQFASALAPSAPTPFRPISRTTETFEQCKQRVRSTWTRTCCAFFPSAATITPRAQHCAAGSAALRKRKPLAPHLHGKGVPRVKPLESLSAYFGCAPFNLEIHSSLLQGPRLPALVPRACGSCPENLRAESA
jgi:hypothetical protein